jgi:nicotinamidase/pyrazinamidase
LDLTPGIASASGEKKNNDKLRAWEEAVPSSIAVAARDVLVVINMQTDFLPDGSPAVADDDAIAPLVNRLARAFDNLVFTYGLHPVSHAALTSHPDTEPFDGNGAPLGNQAPLSDQCEPGADSRTGLGFDRAFLVLGKGADGEVESRSVYSEAEGETTRSLATLLKARGISRVFACGLVTDYCVARLMLDARAAGLETFVIDDACRAIDADGSLGAAWAVMNAAAVWRIQAREILG